MKHNIDADEVYTEFSKKLSKCKGNADDVVSVTKEYSKKILNMNYAPISFKFARCLTKLSVDKLMDPEEYYSIIRAHGSVVINSGDPECNYWFTALVKGSDIEKHGDVISKSGNEQYTSAFVKRIGSKK